MMNRPGDGNVEAHSQSHSYVKQEAVSYGYDASSYLNYASATPTSLNQPLPGQPPLPPMPPPQASVPPPPAMFAQVPQIHTWPHATAWQWITPQTAQQLTQHTHRDLTAFQKEVPARNSYVKRERYNHNRNNVYQHQQRGKYYRNNRRLQRYDHIQGQYDQASYYGATAAMTSQALGLDWQKSKETVLSHMQLPINQSIGVTKQENCGDQNKRDDTGGHKKNKQRKPMSVSYPTRAWNQEDAEKALKTENEHNRSVRAQSLIIKFPDPELNKEIVRNFHSSIQNIHFQSPSGARYCFVQMSEGTDIDEAIKELEKIYFGCGYLKVERKSLRDEDNPVPQEIDPYTLYIGNLPESVNVNEVKSKFPSAVRVDVGYAQKMRNTRYAFIRYNSVDESITAYKAAHSLMWEGRSIIVRFRRQRGNNCPGEPKTNPKIKNEAEKSTASDSISTKVSEKQPIDTKQNKHITSANPSMKSGIDVDLTGDVESTSIKNTNIPAENLQISHSVSSRETALDDTLLEPTDSTQNNADFITEIKKEPVDYEELNEISVEEEEDDDDDDDDEDDEGELYPDMDYGNFDDDSTEDNVSTYKELTSDSPGKTSDDDVPSDNLDTIFKDLVNTASDIGVHDF